MIDCIVHSLLGLRYLHYRTSTDFATPYAKRHIWLRYALLSFEELLLKVAVLADVDPMVLARGTPGFSGADLQNMVK